jgi:hypothetical protein
MHGAKEYRDTSEKDKTARRHHIKHSQQVLKDVLPMVTPAVQNDIFLFAFRDYT